MHIYRCHPALKANRRGPVVGSNSVHLHQSDIDGACGAHCLMMALMILGVLKRPQLRAMSKSRGPAQSMWRVARRNYFVGAGVRELQSMSVPYGSQIETRAYRKNLIARTLDVLADSGVAIIGIGNEHFSHWVLAVGVSGFEADSESAPKKLLLLDPGNSTIPLAAWNATLSVQSNAQDRHAYEMPKSKVFVDLEGVLTIRKAAN